MRLPVRLLALTLLALTLGGETIDRVAVSVGNRVITASELDRQIRLAAFLSGSQPDFRPAARRAMAERMVERRLLESEMETTRYLTPDASPLAPALAAFRKRYFASADDYRRALAAAGLAEADVLEELGRERTLNAFIEARFRPAVQVNEQQIEAYYRANLAGKGVDLAQARADIERLLTAQGADREVDAWLREAKQRTAIVYHSEAFQ